MEFGNALLAKTGESACDGLTRHADDLRDLIMGQRDLNSVGCRQSRVLLRPFQNQAGHSLRRRGHSEGAKLLVRVLTLAAHLYRCVDSGIAVFRQKLRKSVSLTKFTWHGWPVSAVVS